MTVHVDCNLCGENSNSFLFEKQGFNIVKCDNCGLVYVNPRLSENESRQLYQEEGYFKRDAEGFGFRDYIGDREFHIKTFERELDFIEKFKKCGRILDIGCAAGFALNSARDRGWEVYGVEISKTMVEYAKRELDIDVFNGTFEESNFPDGYFDLIITYSTLEHTLDPQAFLKEANRILRNDGLIVIAVPDIGSWFGNRRFQYKPLEHLYYFDHDTISKMLKNAGMEAIAFKKMKVYRSVGFLLERLRYYFKRLMPFLKVVEDMSRRTRLLNLALYAPSGEMVIYARKVTNKNSLANLARGLRP